VRRGLLAASVRVGAIVSASASVSVSALGGGCSHAEPGDQARGPVSGELGPSVVARVGAEDISAFTVGRVAFAQRIPIGAARDLALRDALLAQGAVERSLGEREGARAAARAVLARRLLRGVLAEASQAALTDEEVLAARKRRWLDVDRPEGARVVHAVVRIAEGALEPEKASAMARAAAIRAAVLPLSDEAGAYPSPGATPVGKPGPAAVDPLSEAFRRAMAPFVSGVDADAGVAGARGASGVVVEDLPPVAADGRLLIPTGEGLDADFARGASALTRRGEVSPVVLTRYGVHVMLLLERTPKSELAGEALRAAVRDDVVASRARVAEDQLLAGLRRRVSLASDVGALLAEVQVSADIMVHPSATQ
jgi:hypothetical protein